MRSISNCRDNSLPLLALMIWRMERTKAKPPMMEMKMNTVAENITNFFILRLL
jgi:hypothetical protein